MASRGKVVEKTQVIGAGARKELADALNFSIMGEQVDLAIAWPKYLRLRALFREYIDLHRQVSASPLLDRPELRNARPTVDAHISEFEEIMKVHMSMDLTDYQDSWNLIEKTVHAEFDKRYNEVKKHPAVRKTFAALLEVMTYKNDFGVEEKTVESRLGFLITIPGGSWKPFPYDLDLAKIMTIAGIGKNTHLWVLQLLTGYRRIVKEIWDITQAPDIDIDQFVKMLEGALTQLTSIPELSRCKAAFALIRESMGMLKDNFPAYYRNFVDTNDTTTILHEFVVDVTKANGKARPDIAQQIQTILKFFHKQSAMRSQSSSANSKTSALVNRMTSIADSLLGGNKNTSDANIDAKLSAASREDVVAANAAAAAAAAAANPDSGARGGRGRRAGAARSSSAASAANSSSAPRATDLMSAEELAAFIEGDD